ncbi:SMP-30/gluconolactonase/LRE family protein [Dyadobacter sp. CY312]|uniref:SMP-30/gluconolactonase/LRE family protein n=1 Tax=Dyadobacter sp. CY312 TaxID=2907303 RepID=UPI001F38C46F|nr:SMP-30/gluconolactonase/LRE family protein [Dyadobacter sp. CY312]MCE7043761.1 SMP-30/gluconolactonase/LRE family protein [Dyadobacter sp. CY312]
MKEIKVQEIEIYAEGLDHPECVIYHPNGNLYAGSEAGLIYEINTNREVSEIANTGGFILGLALSADCSWLAICDSGKKCVWKLDLVSKELTLLFNTVENRALQIPNFCCFDQNENLYVSDSGDFRKTTGCIYKMDRSGKVSIWHVGPFNFANGLALSPDNDFLYVVSSFLPGIERIAIMEDGSAGAREVVLEMPQTVPDGIAFDANGTLYISCYAPNSIYNYEPTGKLKELVHDWEAHTITNPTNIAFGGTNFDQLFVANLGRWHISKIDLGTVGLKLVCHINHKTENE